MNSSIRIAAALLACAACKEAPKSSTIVLGQVIDRSGSMATPSWTDSIRLAVGTANQAVPVVCMACTAPEIDDPDATDANPVMQAALRNGKGWNFRTTMSSAYQARVLAKMLASSGRNGDLNGDGRVKVSIYASDEAFGRGFSESLKKEVRELVPAASVEQIYHDVKAVPAEYHWLADISKLTDKHNENTGQNDGVPDAVVVISFPKFEINFTKAYLDSGTKVRLIHTHNFRAARVLDVLSMAVDGRKAPRRRCSAKARLRASSATISRR